MKVKQYSESVCKKYLCDPSLKKQGKLFDKFLSDYQVDIVKIVGKYRRANHKLTPEEVISEANVLIIQNKNKILQMLKSEFDQKTFKKICFAYVKNAVSWSHCRELSSKDNKYIDDSVYQSENGPVTSFDLAIKEAGVDDFFDNFKDEGYIKRFLHVLNKYYYLLSNNESKILNLMIKGWNQDQIAEELQVTRQAISFSYISMVEKLKSQFNFKEINPNNSQEGNKAINSFFAKNA